MVAFGTVHLVYGDFITGIAPSWPTWAPGRPLAARLVGALLVAGGLSIALRRWTRIAGLLLGGLIALSVLFLYVPKIAANPGVGVTWTDPALYLVLAGGAILVAGLNTDRERDPAGEAPSANSIRMLRPVARVLLGGAFILCGVQHFVYERSVAALVPAWIPAHVFWSRFAGVALIAAGVGVWIWQTVRLAALLSGTMIFIWFLILHIPRALNAPGNWDEWSSVFESLAVSGVAFLVAGTSAGRNRRDAPGAPGVVEATRAIRG
jgi:uncharacterized membrane protein